MAAVGQWPRFEKSDGLVGQLVKLSRYYGADSRFVLAGGGNTSVKMGNVLLVKASGSPLAEMTAEDLVEMDRHKLADVLERDFPARADRREEEFKSLIMAARTRPQKNKRPSVECVLHNILPCTFVVHTHPGVVNMLTCCTGGAALARKLLGGADFIWIPYTDPGIVLAKTLLKAVEEHSRHGQTACPSAVLIQNHGMIICGDTPDEIRRNTLAVVAPIRRHVETAGGGRVFGKVAMLPPATARQLLGTIAPALRALTAQAELPNRPEPPSPAACALKVVTFDDSPAVAGLAGGSSGLQAANRGALTPDQIVYCRSLPLWFDARGKHTPPQLVVKNLRSAIARYRSANGFGPKVVLVRGLGLFGIGDDFNEADTARAVYADAVAVMAGAKRLGGIRFLTRAQQDFIEHWEVESYRRQVARGNGTAGFFRAAGKVAVVTGAAQGFGLEIARDLAAQGAHVALADVNAGGAAQAAEEICRRLKKPLAVGLPIDVTDPVSVEEALHQVVRRYGGFDVLVSNAGVLNAGSVKTQSPREFDFVTAVNYRGFFLCVQKACPILCVQRLARGDWWGDVIQINSKSGLEGSNRNAAYAGSKFGGIGLAQSFALELIADGIKVNAICPGNFFEGPLWSDPDKGLFAQYLRTGKVPGARTVADVRRFYEAKVPMGRGCRAADVMKAIYYVLEQEYETGQAIPVTGGQVMLH